ncbi:MAG: hypothetical protein M1445_01365 [Bacteroidetes bacterium]|nr:hypothetical protein [Bacteroidota bacterium]MCL6102413.1 hypothetical protein [Bacteroidota bacterium]
MNSELFAKWLQTEAEMLYQQDSTPEIFLSRAKPLIDALVKINKAEVLSVNDLEEIVTASNSRRDTDLLQKNSYFDIVDLSLYRAN